MSPTDLARMIDHTALKPETTKDQILRLCEEARDYGFAAVCIAPTWVALAARTLQGTKSKVATVIGFPHGNTMSSVKAFEATQVLDAGASELDMVLNVGALKSLDRTTVFHDIASVVNVARKQSDIKVKVILETALLTDDEKLVACELAVTAGADFVKTSTGFGPAGATVDDVRLLRRAVGKQLGVKAAGGIKTLAAVLSLIDAGANRLGLSSSVSVMKEADNAVT